MNYIEYLNLFGVEAKEIPCIKGSGVPTNSTKGAVGLLYMNTDNGDVYKCIGNSGSSYAWVPMDSGGNAGGNAGFVVQDTAPEDTSVLWVDPSDNSDDELVEVPEFSCGGIAVTGAKVGQTVKISAVDENGVPTAWEPMDVSYTKSEIDAIMGSYITDIDTLVGGDG